MAQFGTAGFNSPPTYLQASAWSGSASNWTSLSQAGAGGLVFGCDSVHQVGAGPGGPGGGAVMWSGVAASLVQLNPLGAESSEAHAVSGNQQFGWVRATVNSQTTAAMWSGSAASYVNLNPAGAGASRIDAASGGFEGGSATFDGTNPRAGLWSGSAQSFVSLHPGPGYQSSYILGMTEGEQVGAVQILPTNFPRAALWHGDAASFVNLDPPGSGGYSVLNATCGSAQVGYIAPASGVFAGIWFGTAGSFLNLAQFLPPGVYDESYATSIASDGVHYYVGGYAENASTLRNEAFLWVGTVPAPGALGALGVAGVAASRRRRR